MTRKEKVDFLVRIHEELGPLPLSLKDKCAEIIDKMEERGLLKPEPKDERRSMKGVC